MSKNPICATISHIQVIFFLFHGTKPQQYQNITQREKFLEAIAVVRNDTGITVDTPKANIF